MVKTDAAIAAIVPSVEPFLRTWIDTQRAMTGVPGVQVAVRLRDELLFSYASGVADSATGEGLTTDHAFRIASHSKTFTAVIIMQLVESGELSLDATVGSLVPELRDAPAGSRSVRELLGHQSGIERDGDDANWWQRLRSFPNRNELIEQLRREPVYQANTYFHYSNLAYSLLGVIIENVKGRDYRDIAAELTQGLSGYLTSAPVIGPDLGWGPKGSIVSGHAAPRADYVSGDPETIPPVIAPVDTHAQAAATGFWANAETVSAWASANALGTDLFLTDASKRLMQRKESTITKAGQTRWYGLGWIGRNIGKRAVMGHSGGFPGHITQTWADPKTGLSVSVLTNRIDAHASDWATAIIRLLDLAVAEGRKAESAELFDGQGTYWSLWGDASLIALPGIVLMASVTSIDPAATASVLTPTDAGWRVAAEDSFGAAGELLTVERDAKGVAGVTVTGITSWREDLFAAKRAEMLG